MVAPTGVRHSLRPEQLAPELRHPLVLLRPAQLDARALRPGDTGALEGAERAVVRVAEGLKLDPFRCDALAQAAVAVHAVAGDVEQAGDTGVERRGEREPECPSLV